MKRIFIFAFIGMICSCSVTNQPKTVTAHQSISVYALTKPLSDNLPGTKISLIGSNGKSTDYQLTELLIVGGGKVLVYIPDELFQILKERVKTDLNGIMNLRSGDKIEGYQLTASSLKDKSIFTGEQMESLTPDQRRIAEAYQTEEKYLVWSQIPTKASGTIDESGNIIPDMVRVGNRNTGVSSNQSSQQNHSSPFNPQLRPKN